MKILRKLYLALIYGIWDALSGHYLCNTKSGHGKIGKLL